MLAFVLVNLVSEGYVGSVRAGGLGQSRPSFPSRGRASALASSSPLAAVEATVGKPSVFAATLRALKAEGAAPTFDSIRLAPRLVNQNELTRITKIDPELLLGGKQFDYKTLTLVVVGASSVLSLGAMSLTGLRQDIRFALTYGIVLIPLLLLSVGSLAPGLLALPAAWLQGKGSDSAERTRRHEAAHLLLGYCCGLGLDSFSMEAGKESVQFEGETAGPLTLQGAQALLVVAMGGMIAEYLHFGDAQGGRDDLAQMQAVLTRVSPRLSPLEQQGYTRWAALMAWTYIQNLKPQLEEAVLALGRKETLSEVIDAIESTAARRANANLAA